MNYFKFLSQLCLLKVSHKRTYLRYVLCQPSRTDAIVLLIASYIQTTALDLAKAKVSINPNAKPAAARAE